MLLDVKTSTLKKSYATTIAPGNIDMHCQPFEIEPTFDFGTNLSSILLFDPSRNKLRQHCR